MDKLQIVEKNLATTGLRFANYIIDILCFYACFFCFTIIVGVVSVLFGVDIDFDAWGNINSALDRLITMCLLVFYYFAFEALTKGRTIGKLITGTKVVMEDGEEPTVNACLIRSVSRIMPFEGFSFLFRMSGWHDTWAKTRVVKKKAFEEDVLIEFEIEQIGKNENL
ncbi:MAG: RDD family protein [Prevotellaceae bacterium]|jgi:uncharacterized RDD family membrane protein YckC|nr:RDD family protein [Prevotellaceae bacterium]